MKVTVTKTDSANATASAKIEKAVIDAQIDKIARDAAKTMKVDGFRAGKVPLQVIKARYGEKLTQDAESQALQDMLKIALEELGLKNSDLVGEPMIPKFDKKDDGIDAEITISMRPAIELGDYMAIVPEVKDKRVTAKEIDAKIDELASAQAPFTDIEEDRALESGDQAIFDFEGFVDGVPFEGGKADNFALQIGSNQFIPGFEDQMVGMKKGEERTITVTFPQDYQAAELKGKESEFKLKLHSIQVKGAVELDEETIKRLMPSQEDATLDKLKEQVKENIKNEKRHTYYNEELKPKLTEELVKNYEFDLPKGVVDAEIDNQLNNKIRTMSEEQINELREDASKIEKMRDEARPEAEKSVKLTFIVDALAAAEGVMVSDAEVQQVLQYEAMMYGQDPDATLKQYEEQGLLPMVKMSMVEDRLLTKLLDTKKESK